MPQQILTCPICGGALEETSRWSETYDRDMKDILSVYYKHTLFFRRRAPRI